MNAESHAEVTRDEPGDLTTNERYKRFLRQLPQAKRQAVLMVNTADRCARQLKLIEHWAGPELVDVRAAVTSAAASLRTAAQVLASLPDDYRPRAGRRVAGVGASAGTLLEEGTVVRIGDTHLEEYEGVLDATTGLTVVEQRGNKVLVTGPDGARTWLPRGHVTAAVGA